MAEKIFNARFAQKIDTLTAWASSNIVLKAGEIAFATTAASTGSGLTEPVIVAKIGDGSKTFGQLDYNFYAKASDVYGWAKKDETAHKADLVTWFPTSVEGLAIVDGNLQATKRDGTTYSLPLATDAELAAAIQAVEAKIGDLTKLATENKTDLVTAINEVRQAVEVGGTGSVVTITDANADKVTTYTVKQGDTEVKKILVPDAYDDTDVRALAQKGVDDAAAAAGAVETLKTTEVKANADAIVGLSENKADKATTLAGYGIGDAYTKTETEGKISDAITTFTNAYITSDGGAIDKLQEIADWIDSDKNGAADIIADVEANAGAIEDIVDGTTPAAKATNADNAAKLGGQEPTYYATAQSVTDEVAARGQAITDLTNGITGGTIKAGKAGDAETLGGYEPGYFVSGFGLAGTLANYVTLEEYNANNGNIANSIGAVDTKVTDLDNSLAPVAKSGKLSDLDKTFGEGITDIIFDAGNASGYNA